MPLPYLYSGWLYRLLNVEDVKPSLLHMKLGPGTNLNPLMLQFFTWDALREEMSWWQHMEKEIPELAKLGFTQLWLPPPNKAAAKDGRGYDAYDLWDLGEFDQKGGVATRWGTKQELLSACEVARKHDIGVLIDAVINHKLGADRVETISAFPVKSKDRTKRDGPERMIDAWTAYDFPGRCKYSVLRWTEQHFTGVDWDHKTKSNQIFRITGGEHKGWSTDVDKELGNYDYLLGADIDHQHPDVREDFLNWGPWVLETTGGTGFRLDAIKHIDKQFLRSFLQETKKRLHTPQLFAVAECWSESAKRMMGYVKAFKGETSFFDVPLHMNFSRACKLGDRFDLRRIFKGSLLELRPNDSVTFVDNHECYGKVLGHLIPVNALLIWPNNWQVVGQTLESWVDQSFKLQAYALILLYGKGYPCVFYGDLYPNKECYDEGIAKRLSVIIKARKMFAYGQTRDYFSDRNYIGFVRLGDTTHKGCVIVIDNLKTAVKQSIRMNVGLEHANRKFRSVIESNEVCVNERGWAEFPCSSIHVGLWVPEDCQPI